MSLQINPPAGTRGAVLKHIEELVAGHKANAPHGTDPDQVEAVAALLKAEINSLPSEFNGVRVVCEAVAHAGARTVQICLYPQKVLV